MREKFIIGKYIFAVYILIICVIVSLSNYSFALGYYGTHHGHSGHHGSSHYNSFGYYGTHHSSFGHHGRHNSRSLHGHHGNRLHSSLYNHHGSRLHGQHYGYRSHDRYRHYNSYGSSCNIYIITPSIIGNEGVYYKQSRYRNHYAGADTEDTYEYNNKEPYVFVYGKEYTPGANAYVFQYEQNEDDQSLFAYSKSKD